MSLINQVLKDIEQRQASLQMEETNLKAQLRPVLSMQDSQWRFPTWLKLFLLGFMLGGLVYLVWHTSFNKHDGAPANNPTQTVAPGFAVESLAVESLAVEVHPQLTKTLSSDWQTLAQSDEPSKKESHQKSTKSAPQVSKDLPKPVLNQTDNLKITNPAEKTEPASVTKPATIANPITTSASNGNPTPSSNNSVISIKPADPHFTSAVTPITGAESAQVVKQMKPEQEANQYLQRAIDLHQKGRVSEAIEATKKALSLSPQSEEARQLQANYLVEIKQPQEAMQVLQAGLQLQPKQLALRKALIKLQLAEGQQEKALETLQQGAEAAPRDADYSALWALTLQKANKHHAALPLFEQALHANPNQAQWLVGYAVSLQAEGRTQDALKQFQEAQSLPTSERMSAFIQQRIQQLQNP